MLAKYGSTVVHTAQEVSLLEGVPQADKEILTANDVVIHNYCDVVHVIHWLCNAV